MNEEDSEKYPENKFMSMSCVFSFNYNEENYQKLIICSKHFYHRLKRREKNEKVMNLKIC